MSRVVIYGGKKLNGSVWINGSKNLMLPVMAASLLNRGVTVIHNFPDIVDVRSMQEILEYLECRIKRDKDTMIIDTSDAVFKPLNLQISGKLRASTILMGPMLARFGKADIAKPGGCNIGERPVDIHLNAFKRLGAYWEMSDTRTIVSAARLHANRIDLRLPSVGATENAIMAAVCSTGITTLTNVAKEPEIISLCDFLRGAGAVIQGAGTNTITVSGVASLNDSEYTIPPDRIVAGTYIAAVCACGGDILLENCTTPDLSGYLNIYQGMGAVFSYYAGGIRVCMKERPVNLNYIKTEPFPGFPTDMQSITLSVAAVSKGNLTMSENVFEDRFKVVKWLNRMGADICVSGRNAFVRGVSVLTGTTVTGEDLRGNAALIVAGLCARGMTIVNDSDYINRGYCNLCENLKKLGADIKWEND